MGTLALQLFKEMVSRRADQVDLAAAALLIAMSEYPNLNVSEYLQKIQDFADRIKPQLQTCAEQEPINVVEKINQHLFGAERFRGNQENYYDSRNSFLNEVLDRRLGIPITLSVIYLEVAKRLGLELHGVGMPGHFLVKCIHRGLEIFIDPFGRGEILLEDACRRKLSQIHGANFQFDRAYLSSVNNLQILTRMLTNLKAIYLKQQDYSRTLDTIEKLLLVTPDAPVEIRDRGVVNYKLNRLSQAMKDWHHYLELSPGAPDTSEIEKNLTAVGNLLAFRN